MAELLSRAEHSLAKLDAQDDGKKSRGRKLSDAGARARLYHEVIEAGLGRIIKVDLKNEPLSWDLNEDALAQARLMAGKLLWVTNVADLTPTEVLLHYKRLAYIERGFHVLKSTPRPTTQRRPPPEGDESSGQATLTHEAESFSIMPAQHPPSSK